MKLKFTIQARQARFLNDGHDDIYGPQYFNDREFKVFAATEKEALKKVEEIYGHADREELANGTWTEIYIDTIEEQPID